MIAVAKEQQPIRVRQGLLVICPECGCRCFANGSTPTFTKYYCSNASCSYSVKVSRPQYPDSGRLQS